jgi:O-methyltransferase
VVPAGATLGAKLLHHLRRGTLFDRLMERAGILPEHMKVRWRGAKNERQAVRALVRWAELDLVNRPAGSWVLSLGDGGPFHRQLDALLRSRGLSFRSSDAATITTWQAPDVAGLCGIVCGLSEASQLTQASRAVAGNPLLERVPFEYAAGINVEHAQFKRQDEYADTYFVAPSLIDSPNPYALYQESLQHFEQKTGLRDYLDLYQVLRHVVRNNVEGCIAEFGSYRGQSGWLIARTLQALGAERRVYMFDTFEEFPTESMGVDQLWNRSHQVSYEDVRRKLSPFTNVTLVKGDITQTLPTTDIGKVALAFIDCDSYRATRFLLNHLWDRHVGPGAAFVVEDYGHPALLGSRAAVHEELDQRPGCMQFFSQFSGLLIVVRG